MALKRKGELKRMWACEGWDKIAIWGDGRWVDVGTGYGGEMDGDDPILTLSRSCFYDTTTKERNAMIKAIDSVLDGGGDLNYEYQCYLQED